jgi:hypothetical protein
MTSRYFSGGGTGGSCNIFQLPLKLGEELIYVLCTINGQAEFVRFHVLLYREESGHCSVRTSCWVFTATDQCLRSSKRWRVPATGKGGVSLRRLSDLRLV